MRRFALLLIGLTPVLSVAGPVEQTFGSGILGVPWGTTLDHLEGLYPEGDNMFANAAGHRAYWVRDGATFLGVPRDRQGVLCGLDPRGHVVIATVAFGFDRKEQLWSVLQSLLGSPTHITTSESSRSSYWPVDGGMHVELREFFGTPSQAIIWLNITGPEYRQPTARCPDRSGG